MDGLERAKLKDEILNLISDKPKGADFLWIKYNIKNKDISDEDLKDHLEEIGNDSSKIAILIIGETYHLQRTMYTAKFLEANGYTGIYEYKINNKIAKDKGLALEFEAKQIQREKDKIQLTLAKWQKITFIPVFIFGLLGGCYSLYKIIKPSDNVKQEAFDSRLKSIETQLEALKTAKEEVLIGKPEPVVIDSTKLTKK